ncbi:MAG TPA: hypothetical protein VIJ65_02725 [Acidobacteriaceae bacterium]
MNAIQNIQDRLHGTNALIARYEAALDNPTTAPNDAAALAVNLRSLRNLQARLESQFFELAASQNLEVYKYRLLVGQEAPSLAGVGEAWSKLQAFFASVYESLTKVSPAPGKKPVQSAFQTPELGYAYSFPGSVGVVITLPRPVDVALLTESPVDEASNIVFNLLESRDMGSTARTLGPSPMRAMNEWLGVHVRYRYGADLEWRGASGRKRHAHATYDDILKIQTAVLDTKTRQTTTTTGLLTAVDWDGKTFRLKADSGEEISGKYGEGVIQLEHAASVPARYTVTVVTITDVIQTDIKSKPEIILEHLEAL